MSKFLPIILDWLFKDFLLPFIKMISDKSKIRQVINKDNKAIEDLNNAKSDSDIDRAIDNIP